MFASRRIGYVDSNMSNVLVFLPSSLNYNKSGYLEGVRKEHKDCEAFYVTNDQPVKESSSRIIGFLGNDSGKSKSKPKGLLVDSSAKLLNFPQQNVVKIIYDLAEFRDCDSVNSEHFQFLCDNLKKRPSAENGHIYVTWFLDWLLRIFTRFKPLASCATFSHLCDNIRAFRWFLQEFMANGLTPKCGNFLLAKLFDVALGYFLLGLFLDNENFIVSSFVDLLEKIIHNFRDLLIYLMGSPIGLKLNHSFNKCLGTFFFYHISLWRVFVIAMQPLIKNYFKFLVQLGIFGFSYQIAVLSDLIAMATFHVYCIYVYAARLMYVQLKGLLSLWRLFIGRKHNPLRLRVDSYQYSHHQLFIGTLGFTVFLFLLPTTAMYYTVFVIFRLAVLVAEETLQNFRRTLHCLPFYTLILYLVQSSHLAGPVYIKQKPSKDGVIYEAHLKTLSLYTSVIKFAPHPTFWVNLRWKEILTGVSM